MFLRNVKSWSFLEKSAIFQRLRRFFLRNRYKFERCRETGPVKQNFQMGSVPIFCLWRRKWMLQD